jgi:hypothetical protein
MIKILPPLRMTLHFLQIGFTDALTFIVIFLISSSLWQKVARSAG